MPDQSLLGVGRRYLPVLFRKYGLGPLIGTRTWGGIRKFCQLLDQGYISVPEDSLYGLPSERVIEHHGVDPDIRVETVPHSCLPGTIRKSKLRLTI